MQKDCIPVTTGINKCSYGVVTFYVRPAFMKAMHNSKLTYFMTNFSHRNNYKVRRMYSQST